MRPTGASEKIRMTESSSSRGPSRSNTRASVRPPSSTMPAVTSMGFTAAPDSGITSEMSAASAGSSGGTCNPCIAHRSATQAPVPAVPVSTHTRSPCGRRGTQKPAAMATISSGSETRITP